MCASHFEEKMTKNPWDSTRPLDEYLIAFHASVRHDQVNNIITLATFRHKPEADWKHYQSDFCQKQFQKEYTHFWDSHAWTTKAHNTKTLK